VKALFGSLLCLALATSQAFALKGGPDYGGGSTSLVGTYAGVLQGLFDPTNPLSSNSIGIFSLRVPQASLSTGAFLMFAQGRVFRGTINGVGDPNSSSFKGILEATFDYTISFVGADGSVQTIPVTATVNGNLNARVQSGSGFGAAVSATLLRGDATLYIDQGEVDPDTFEPIITSILLMTVNGFKQSNTAPGGAAGPTG